MLIVIFAECVHFWGSKILLRCLWNWLWVVLYKRYMFTVALLWDWCRYAFVLCCADLQYADHLKSIYIDWMFLLSACNRRGAKPELGSALTFTHPGVPKCPKPSSIVNSSYCVCVLMNRPNWIKDSSRCEFTMSQDSVSK